MAGNLPKGTQQNSLNIIIGGRDFTAFPLFFCQKGRGKMAGNLPKGTQQKLINNAWDKR